MILRSHLSANTKEQEQDNVKDSLEADGWRSTKVGAHTASGLRVSSVSLRLVKYQSSSWSEFVRNRVEEFKSNLIIILWDEDYLFLNEKHRVFN